MPRHKKPLKQALPPIIAGTVLGGLVHYYDNGWRTGNLSSIETKGYRVIPIGDHKRSVLVSPSNIKPVDPNLLKEVHGAK